MIHLLLMINTEGFFAHIFKNAHENSIIITDDGGKILYINKCFINVFGYNQKDLEGKHFRILFTEKDQKLKRPEREVEDTLADGAKSDDTYLVDKKGNRIWVMGESILAINNLKERYIVKIIQNIHAQKQLEHFLLESTEFIDTIFEALPDTSLVILDSNLKILKTNKAFQKMFGLKEPPAEESRLTQIDNTFWRRKEIKKQLTEMIVNRIQIKNSIQTYLNSSGKEKKFTMNSRFIQGETDQKKILLVLKYKEVK